MPILDKIELELNSKINEWINVRNTINRYLQSVEHQVKWKKRYKNKLMLSCFMILAWYATICSNFPLSYYNLTQDTSEEIIEHDCHWGCPELTWFNWIVLMTFINLLDYLGLIFLRSFFLYFVYFVLFLMILQCLLSIIPFIWY